MMGDSQSTKVRPSYIAFPSPPVPSRGPHDDMTDSDLLLTEKMAVLGQLQLFSLSEPTGGFLSRIATIAVLEKHRKLGGI